MQRLTYSYPARLPLLCSVHVGVVASGDLEIVMLPTEGTGQAEVEVRTSVEGFDTVWRRVLERHLSDSARQARYLINDFGATPGMVGLRLAQAAEIAEEDAPS
ncbi:malonate decarboxylase acyl carrier protein [Streptomyces sp. NPDC055037]